MFKFSTSANLDFEGEKQKRSVSEMSSVKNLPGERIRVLRIAHASLTPALRGRERGIVQKFPEIEMEVITTPRWHEAGVDVEAIPDDLFPVKSARTFLSKHIQLFAYDPLPIIKSLREFRPHIIDMNHEPYSVPCAEILTLRNRFAPETPIVMQTAQNIYKNYPLPFSLLEKRALRRISAAYMCSETTREVLEAKGFDKPMRIVPFGVDLEMFEFKPHEKREVLTIGYVGRLLPAKGLMTLADALAKIKSDQWNLLVVGDGEERPKVEKRLVEYSLLERARFTGAVAYENTPDYFRQIDVLVVPTQTTAKIREQFGRVIIEAMACGTAVVGSTSGAIPEVIADAGIIFSENNAESLATELKRLIHNRNLLAILGEKGRKRVETHYTWESVAEKIFSLYCRVLRQKSVGSTELCFNE